MLGVFISLWITLQPPQPFLKRPNSRQNCLSPGFMAFQKVSSAGQSHGAVCSLILIPLESLALLRWIWVKGLVLSVDKGKLKSKKLDEMCPKRCPQMESQKHTIFWGFFLPLKRQSEGVLALALLDQVLHLWRASNRAGAVALGCCCRTGIRRRAFALLKLPQQSSRLALGTV